MREAIHIVFVYVPAPGPSLTVIWGNMLRHIVRYYLRRCHNFTWACQKVAYGIDSYLIVAHHIRCHKGIFSSVFIPNPINTVP